MRVPVEFSRRLAPLFGFVLGLTFVGAASSTSQEKTSFTVAVVPQFAPLLIQRDWAPLLARLEQATGYRFELRVYDHIRRFESDLAREIPDLAFLNPYHMVMAREKQGYRPLVRNDAYLNGILVVRLDSPVTAVGELHGKKLAFPSPNALGASLYLRALLTEQAKISFTPIYVGNHQNVFRQVLAGEVEAGGAVHATLAKEPPAVQSQLRVLFAAPGLAPHPLAAHPRVSPKASRKIIKALLALRDDATSAKLLADAQLGQVVAADYDRDYAGLARLRLDRYADSTEQ